MSDATIAVAASPLFIPCPRCRPSDGGAEPTTTALPDCRRCDGAGAVDADVLREVVAAIAEALALVPDGRVNARLARVSDGLSNLADDLELEPRLRELAVRAMGEVRHG